MPCNDEFGNLFQTFKYDIEYLTENSSQIQKLPPPPFQGKYSGFFLASQSHDNRGGGGSG